jgi:hypothetical protein
LEQLRRAAPRPAEPGSAPVEEPAPAKTSPDEPPATEK